MSLIKDQEMTEKNRAAHRANGRKSRGAATPEGKERARAANLRHGVYSKLRDQALEALGEDPAHLAALIAGGYAQWRPTNPDQAWIVERLGSLKFRLERYERRQETLVARRITKVDKRRQEAVQQARDKYADVRDLLHVLRGGAARPDFYAPPIFFRHYDEAVKVSPSPMMTRIGELLSQLREPLEGEPTGPTFADPMPDKLWATWRDDFSKIEYPVPSALPAVQGEEREAVRAELWESVDSEQDLNARTWEAELDRQGAPLPIEERDTMALEMSKELDFLRRQEGSAFREFIRLGNFLLKLQAADQARNKVGRREAGAEQGSAMEPNAQFHGAPAGLTPKTAGASG